MKQIMMLIGLLAAGAVCAQVKDQGWRFVVQPESVETQEDGAVRIRYDISEVPLETSLNSVIWYKGKASGSGSNPSFAVWAVDGEGARIERISEVTIKPNTHGTISFPVSGYVREHLKDGKVSFLIVPRAASGFSQSVEFSGKPALAIVKTQTPNYDRQVLLRPIWKRHRMVNETLLPTSYDGKPAKANLAFAPSKIISVKNYALDKTYTEGADYTVEGRILRLMAGSAIPYFNYEELYHNNPDAKPRVMKTVDGGYLTFSESAMFNDKQLAVSYEHSEPWGGLVPQSAKKLLPKTFQALEKGDPLKLVVFGDSISVGASASGKTVRAPWMPRWADLVAGELAARTTSEIDYINPSLGGMRSDWGRDAVDGLVSFEKPDLVILGFGMNDAGANFSVEKFIANTTAIMDAIRKQNPAAEFILLMSFQPNSQWRNLDLMSGYLPAMKAMEGPGVAVADVWSIHEYLLKHKTYWDMTGNHVNHPNDFLVRVYAQTVLATLGRE
ncbi:MAG: SGNH/GDSL hydrolase family protein [Verrucomicrobiota bacterium]|nr:SGNH/GDSL hydrolase family protein [Verrucomicrobiota bacterium]